MSDPRLHGPETCHAAPAGCEACSGRHHWLDTGFDTEGEADEDALTADELAVLEYDRANGTEHRLAYFGCKHCSAWAECDYVWELEDQSFQDAQGAEMNDHKKPLTGLFRDSPETPEGKYLVKRRDGTVVEWPSFVLGARDPIAAVALRAYAREVRRLIRDEPQEAARLGLTPEFADRLTVEAGAWDDYRGTHGVGDPGMGRHRKDDPATIAEMRKGKSA